MCENVTDVRLYENPRIGDRGMRALAKVCEGGLPALETLCDSGWTKGRPRRQESTR